MESRDAVSELNQYKKLIIYHRTIWNTVQKGEKCLEIINKVGKMADIEGYDLVKLMLHTKQEIRKNQS